ncbi:hypothetical protein [Spirosoma sp.]|uniref:hypothetical protein n=1 Tax=Spirosoma sp. TaxID=1899569 RepID=UPI00262634BA|nr:hypothetical protein [Spirosoma sp.]MCX6217687.1 hypothetical protein [Spirosoma sp.]
MLQRNLTIDKAATSATVRQVIAYQGEETTTKVVCAILKLFNDGLNVSNQMSNRQLLETAMIWMETYPHDTVKDLILCLKNVKAGKYGKEGQIFNRIDGAVIANFFNRYLEDKAEWGEQQNQLYKSNQIKASTGFFQKLDSETAGELKRMLQRANIRATPDVQTPLSSDKHYSTYLAQHAEDIEFEVLTNLNQRAKQQGIEEVVKITQTELSRRSAQDQADYEAYEKQYDDTQLPESERQ